MEIHVFLAATTLGPHTQGTEGRELVDNGAICAQEIQCALTTVGKICCSYGVNHGDLHSQTLYIYGLIWVNQLTMFHHRKSDLWASMVRSAYRG